MSVRASSDEFVPDADGEGVHAAAPGIWSYHSLPHRPLRQSTLVRD